MSLQIAIDGPSGSGKSTLAKNLARELNLMYIDTGAMYRSVGLFCIKNNINLNDSEKIISNLNKINIEIKHIDYSQHIFLNKEDITDELRTQEVADASSKVAIIPEVRKKLVAIQQEIGINNNVVMDGRDIGTVVLKDATLKIFLDANIKKRTERRINELTLSKKKFDKNKIEQDLIERDERDKNRNENPLIHADNSIYIDSTNLSESELTALVKDLLKKGGL